MHQQYKPSIDQDDNNDNDEDLKSLDITNEQGNKTNNQNPNFISPPHQAPQIRNQQPIQHQPLQSFINEIASVPQQSQSQPNVIPISSSSSISAQPQSSSIQQSSSLSSSQFVASTTNQKTNKLIIENLLLKRKIEQMEQKEQQMIKKQRRQSSRFRSPRLGRSTTTCRSI